MRDLHRVRTLLENTLTGVEVHCYFVPWVEQGEDAGFGAAERVD